MVQACVGSNPTTPAIFFMSSKEVLLSLNSCTFSYEKSKLFKDLSFVIHKNDKIALVGKNGVGKTSLFGIFSKKLVIDEGEIWFNPHTKITAMDQKNFKRQDSTLFEFILSEQNHKITYDDFKIKNLFQKVKLNWNLNMKHLSGGQLRKLTLIKSLIDNPDLLLLDEPTNHLDIESIKWLEHFLLKEFKGTFLIVSHNRDFLKKITNKVFWIDRGKIKVSPKGFSFFEKWKSTLISQEERELKKKKKILDNEIEWLSKGVKARRKRNIRRKEEFFSDKSNYEEQRASFQKTIKKIKIPMDNKEILDGPNILINFINLSKKFRNGDETKTIIKDFNFKLMKKERVGIIGKNGVGKSTFLKMISGDQAADQGHIKIKKNIEFSFFNQESDNFDYGKSIKNNLIPSGGDYISVGEKKIHICGYLKNFYLTQKILKIKLEICLVEKNRLLLSKILANPKEVMLLDEPTNDLDMETIDILVDFLKIYSGGVLISSHDIDFLSQTCKKIYFS